MEIIRLSNISFNYPQKNGNTGFSIEELDLSISEGDFLSILGPNGSGKSTLVKLIAHIFEPMQGEMYLLSKKYNEFNRNEFAKLISLVPQNSGTNFPFSIFEIVMMGRSPYLNFMGIENSDDKKLVMDTLDLLEISHLKNKGINEVSGGEAQRALIARAIVQQPKILLLDEPSSHLDIKHQLSIYNLLHELNLEKSITIVAVSHDINLSSNFSSRVVLMKNGKIEYDSIPGEVLTSENIESVFGVLPNIIQNNDQSFISFVK